MQFPFSFVKVLQYIQGGFKCLQWSLRKQCLALECEGNWILAYLKSHVKQWPGLFACYMLYSRLLSALCKQFNQCSGGGQWPMLR